MNLSKKVGLRIKELERLYGIEHGGDRKSKGQNDLLKTQSDIAKEMDMDTTICRNLKTLKKEKNDLERKRKEIINIYLLLILYSYMLSILLTFHLRLIFKPLISKLKK
ncbi:MAG: hypothetical protein PHY44_01720 [Lachnospiraceae bacterium]|nr:hypothetical protein [Lachnospiraceae bacterium]